jgi:DNA repair exonuclease SbcCD ATPase subunit
MSKELEVFLKENKMTVDPQLMELFDKSKVDIVKAKDILVICKQSLEIVEGWEQHLSMTVDGPDDTTTIATAGDIRKKIVKDRKASERYIKAEREKVQKEKEIYDMKDKGLLKVFQYLEEKAKNVEEHLEAIEKLPERLEKERLDKLEQERKVILEDIGVNPDDYSIRDMADEPFTFMVAGIKAQKELAEKERLEQEAQIQKEKEQRELFAKRQQELSKFSLVPGCEPLISALSLEMSEESYQKIQKSVIDIYNKHQEDQIKVRQEAERARLAQIESDKKLKEEQDKLLQQQEAARLVQEQAEKEAQQKAEQVRVAQERQEAILELGFVFSGGKFLFDKHNLSVDITKEEMLDYVGESYRNKFRIVSKTIEDAKVLPLDSWIDSFEIPVFTPTKNKETEAKRQLIITRFAGFKKWAKKL